MKHIALNLTRRWLLIPALGFLMALAGCSERSAGWNLYNVTGHLPKLDFALQAAGDKTMTHEALLGKTVMVYFGYASCPDICPTTMAQLTEVINKLGEKGENVRILFVSVDPHRDTPDILQAYVNGFNANAIGLTGSERTIARLAKRYRIAYQIDRPRPGDDPNVYNVTHSEGIYIFDNKGRARLLASNAEDTDAFTADMRQLIDQTQ